MESADSDDAVEPPTWVQALTSHRLMASLSLRARDCARARADSVGDGDPCRITGEPCGIAGVGGASASASRGVM